MTLKSEIRALLPKNMESGEAAAKKIAEWVEKRNKNNLAEQACYIEACIQAGIEKKGEGIRKIKSIFKMKPGTGGDFYYLTSDEFEKVGQAIREFCEEK